MQTSLPDLPEVKTDMTDYSGVEIHTLIAKCPHAHQISDKEVGKSIWNTIMIQTTNKEMIKAANKVKMEAFIIHLKVHFVNYST